MAVSDTKACEDETAVVELSAVKELSATKACDAETDVAELSDVKALFEFSA